MACSILLTPHPEMQEEARSRSTIHYRPKYENKIMGNQMVPSGTLEESSLLSFSNTKPTIKVESHDDDNTITGLTITKSQENDMPIHSDLATSTAIPIRGSGSGSGSGNVTAATATATAESGSIATATTGSRPSGNQIVRMPANPSNYIPSSSPMIVLVGDPPCNGKTNLLRLLTGFDWPTSMFPHSSSSSFYTSCATSCCPIVVTLQRPQANDSEFHFAPPRRKRATVTIQWNTSSSVYKTIRSSPRRRKREIERMQQKQNQQQQQQQQQQSTSNPSLIPPPIFEPRILMDDNSHRHTLQQDLPIVIQQAQQVVVQYRQRSWVPWDTISVVLESSDISHHMSVVDYFTCQAGSPWKEETRQECKNNNNNNNNNNNSNNNQSTKHPSQSKPNQTFSAVGIDDVILDWMDSCIVLPLLSTNDYHDMNSQRQWLSVARSIDPTTRHIIPILLQSTNHSSDNHHLDNHKNDTNEADIIFRWMTHGHTISGLLHGFHLVALHPHCADMAETGSSIPSDHGRNDYTTQQLVDDALLQEHNVVPTMERWKSYQESNGETISGGRFGISSLQIKVKEVQEQILHDSIPTLQANLKQQCVTCRQKMDAMGPRYTSLLDQRQCYQAVTDRLLQTIHQQLSGKNVKETVVWNDTSPARHIRNGRSDAKTIGNVHSNAATGNKSLEESVTLPFPPSAAARLQHACQQFCQAIQSGSLATITKLVEGAHVRVSDPNPPFHSVRGEIIHIHIDSHGKYAYVDFVDPSDSRSHLLLDSIGCTITEDNMAKMEENDFWMDKNNNMFIARDRQRYDCLRKIPCHHLRTDPTWLVMKMSQYQGEDIPGFVNMNMVHQIISDFVREDWVPHCYHLLQTANQIWSETLSQCLDYAFGPIEAAFPTCPPADKSGDGSGPQKPSLSIRYPMLGTTVAQICRQVSESLFTNARYRLEETLELEQHHSYTYEDELLDAMTKARLSSLRKQLDLHLQLDRKSKRAVLDGTTISAVLDHVLLSGPNRSPSTFHHHPYCYTVAEDMELILSLYGEVATKRIVDGIPMICWQFFRTLPIALEEALRCITDSTLTRCFEENAETQHMHEELSQQMHELSGALAKLQSMV